MRVRGEGEGEGLGLGLGLGSGLVLVTLRGYHRRVTLRGYHIPVINVGKNGQKYNRQGFFSTVFQWVFGVRNLFQIRLVKAI